MIPTGLFNEVVNLNSDVTAGWDAGLLLEDVKRQRHDVTQTLRQFLANLTSLEALHCLLTRFETQLG
jgi:hypothetical protein